MEHITILGSGGFGLSLALSAYRSGHAVKVWSKFPEELEAIRRDGEHKQKLPGVPIPSEITLTADLEAAISGADLVIFGIPSSFLRATAKLAAPYLYAPMVIVNTGKGLEAGTHYTMSQICRRNCHTCQLSRLQAHPMRRKSHGMYRQRLWLPLKICRQRNMCRKP